MLLRTDPARDFDRWTRQLPGTAAHPAVMPMDAWRAGDQFIVEFDLPGAHADSLEIGVEHNVLTVRAERPGLDPSREVISAERFRGVLTRQLFLGENLDPPKIAASYQDGVLRLTIPIAEKAKPRRIEISRSDQKTAINV
jgi:HSP20 family protein